jgi:hypothetical protein
MMTHTAGPAALTFAVTLAALYAAHSVADHWIQTDHQAVTKGGTGWAARLADLRHVLTYTATLAIVLAVVDWRCHLPYDLTRVTAALVFNGITHYIADRRSPVTNLATKLGKAGWLKHDPEAGYKLDQSWHMGFLLVTALIIA